MQFAQTSQHRNLQQPDYSELDNQIQLQRLYKRLEERGYEIHISDEALKLLSANGYDPVYGARPL
ncbi:hypothetical protein MJL33_32220, partial [Salmonella enterica subsp. enterica serovar Kentucky]|nr:hypothetical protein [Salmonella enterica subsp. enterica serovar Kentucky]